MGKDSTDQFSAAAQGLGYIYQPRFALLRLLQLPENTSVLMEKDDDLDFVDHNGVRTLSSLKHKSVGDRLTDMSTDFWKSVRIWLARYERDGRGVSSLRFFLFTTGAVAETSFLNSFLQDPPPKTEKAMPLSRLVENTLKETTSKIIEPVKVAYHQLAEAEKEDFLSRIVIFDGAPRIVDIPSIIKDHHMRSIRREFRDSIFERLEGWWNNISIELLTGKRLEPICGYEVSDKLSFITDEYKSDNLPITYRGKTPIGEIDAEGDARPFVVELRKIGISSNRIRNAILDYYRAFEQRSAWARENLLVSGEMEDYEDRLVDEWSRYKDVVHENLAEDDANDVLSAAGRALYQWADLQSGNIPTLRIRDRVTEPYVVRGGFHILANADPSPRVYWFPRFLDRVATILEAVE